MRADGVKTVRSADQVRPPAPFRDPETAGGRCPSEVVA